VVSGGDLRAGAGGAIAIDDCIGHPGPGDDRALP
jgi:hypothetical protein